MTRWISGYRNAEAIYRIATIINFSGATTSLDSSDFHWPDLAEIEGEQTKYLDHGSLQNQLTSSFSS